MTILEKVPAVILAGGRGTRLRPFTVTFPKPLVPLGDRPILDRLLMQLADAGVARVVLSLGHLSSLIRAYVSQQEHLCSRLNIEFIEEDRPLGTAGAVGMLEFDSSFFVMNGDLLTDVDFADLYRSHRESGAILTVARTVRRERIDFGVLDLDENGWLRGYREKPEYTYSVSMGVYLYEPQVLGYIERGERLDFPDLVLRLLADGKAVATYVHPGLWLDIGRPDDYARAQELVAAE
jgi:NDP-sugar pyrophosphorylase family protein